MYTAHLHVCFRTHYELMKQAAIFKYLHLITVCKYSVGARLSESCLYAPISYLGCIKDNAKHLWLNGILPAIKRR